MTQWTIEEAIIPQDEQGFQEAFAKYKMNPSQPNPLDNFVPNRWRIREIYDDASSDQDRGPAALSVVEYLKLLNVTTGRQVRVNPSFV